MGSNEVQEVRRIAINMNQVFAKMAPLIFSTRILSLNAQIASAPLGAAGYPFAVVARELAVMSAEITQLVNEASSSFCVINEIAQTVMMERKLQLFREALHREWLARDAVGREQEKLPCGREWHTFLEGQDMALNASTHAACSACAVGLFECNLWRQTMKLGMGLMENFKRIDDLSKRLTSLVERIRWVAARKSHFIGVSANVEASRFNGNGTSIRAVAENITLLAGNIAAMQDRMHEAAMELTRLVPRAVDQMRREGMRNMTKGEAA